MAPNDYNPGTERLQVQASPNLITQQAHQPDSVHGLLAALGVALPAATQVAGQVTDKMQDEQKDAATAYAHSMTVDELGQKVRSGELLPPQSPAYVATVQHIYGQNLMEQHQQETLSKIGTGELQFADHGALEKYLVDMRNQAMQGQSRYTTAGYDTGIDQFTQRAMAINAHITDSAFVQRGSQEASDNLAGTVSQVTAPDFQGDSQAAADTVMQRFQLLSATKVLLTPEQKKDAWSNTLNQLAEGGHRDVLTKLLETKTPDGITVASIVGGQQARMMQNAAHSVDDGLNRKRVDSELAPWLDTAHNGELSGAKRVEFDKWYEKNNEWVSAGTRETVINAQRVIEDRLARANAKAEALRMVDASVAAAEQTTRTAIASGTLPFLPPLTVLHKDGSDKKFDAVAFAQSEIPKIVAERKLPLTQQMMLWSTNNVENPQWKSIIAAGASNIASVGWASDGKTVGMVNDQGKAALDMYSQLHQVNPAEAEKYAGPNARLFGDIMFMQQKGGFPDINSAVTLVNQVQRSGITPDEAAVKSKAVMEAVHEITDPRFFALHDQSTVQWVKGLFGGNHDVNLTQVSEDIKRRSELLVMSGQVPDAKSAVKATVEYLSRPEVSSKVNNTLYYNKDLPSVPKGENPGEWMEKFIADGPAKIATAHGLDGSAVRLAPNAQGGYTGWVGGVPLTNEAGHTMVYRKADVESWVNSSYQKELLDRVAGSNYDAYRERMLGSTFGRKGLLDSLTPGPEGSGTMWYGPKGQQKPIYLNDLLSKETYGRLQKEGLANGSIDQIVQSFLAAQKKPERK